MSVHTGSEARTVHVEGLHREKGGFVLKRVARLCAAGVICAQVLSNFLHISSDRG